MVRDKLPFRTPTPTKTPNEGNWTEHKPDLRIGFHEHCGYCGSYDGFRHTWFEVDHFIPKSFFEPLGNISNVAYHNLVYSCKFCNNKKLAKWPSKSETIFHNDVEGFIDPCDPAYESHLCRTVDGAILWKTDLGKWMVTKAFKFDERIESLKVLWQLNQIRKTLDKMIDMMNSEVENSAIYLSIEEKAKDLSFKYYKYHKELIRFYNE